MLAADGKLARDLLRHTRAGAGMLLLAHTAERDRAARAERDAS